MTLVVGLFFSICICYLVLLLLVRFGVLPLIMSSSAVAAALYDSVRHAGAVFGGFVEGEGTPSYAICSFFGWGSFLSVLVGLSIKSQEASSLEGRSILLRLVRALPPLNCVTVQVARTTFRGHEESLSFLISFCIPASAVGVQLLYIQYFGEK